MTSNFPVRTHENNRVGLIHEVVPRPCQAAREATARELVVDEDEGIGHVVPEQPM